MSHIDLAVILAAGMGTRLKEHGKLKPKGFLQLGERPIIEESLQRLRSAGIQRVLIVTGHQAQFYEQLAEDSKGYVRTVHNAQYADSGSMYSLYCAREHIDSDFLLLESDLIYEQRALQQVLDFAGDNAVMLSGTTHSGDEVYVEVKGDTITGMSKNKAELSGDIAGELVGVNKISLPLFEHMTRLAELRFQQSLHWDYETDALVQAAKHYPVYHHLVADLLWAEIDDAAHLERARQRIYPAICARDS